MASTGTVTFAVFAVWFWRFDARNDDPAWTSSSLDGDQSGRSESGAKNWRSTGESRSIDRGVEVTVGQQGLDDSQGHYIPRAKS